MFKVKKYYFLLTIILILIITKKIFALEPVLVDNDLTEISIAKYIEYHEDKTGKLKIGDIVEKKIAWQQNRKDDFNFGFKKSNYWFRFKINNIKQKSDQIYLEVESSWLANIEVFIPKGDKKFNHKINGILHPFSTRDVDYRTFIFNIKEKTWNDEYFIMVNSHNPVNLRINLLTPDALYKKVVIEYPLLFIYYGFILIMIFYNLFIFISIKDKSYIYYVICFSGFMFTQLIMNGLANQFIWSHTQYWNEIVMFVPITTFSGLMFLKYYVQTKDHNQIIDKIISILAFVNLISAFVIVLSFKLFDFTSEISRFNIVFIPILNFISILTGLICSGILAYKKNRQALIFLISFFFIIFGSSIREFVIFGILPLNFFTEYSIQIGSALTIVFLSLGLADKIKILKDELQVLNENLEEKVDKRTYKLRESEEKYRTFINEATDIIYKIDWEENLKFVNKVGIEKFGYSHEEIYNMNIADLIPPDYIKPVVGFYKNQLKSKTDRTSYEFPFQSNSGEVFWVWQSAKAIKDSEGNIVEIDCIARDVTEWKKTEDELEEANIKLLESSLDLEKKVQERTHELEEANIKLVEYSIEVDRSREEAEHANINKSKFLANISHELRTPLNSINGIIDLLQFGIYDFNEEIVPEIEKNIDKLKKISSKNDKDAMIVSIIQELDSIKNFLNGDGNCKKYVFQKVKEKFSSIDLTKKNTSISSGFNKIIKVIDKEEKEIFNAYKRVKDAGNHLLGLIDDILNLSKIEVGKIEVNNSEVNIKDIIESVIIYSKSYIKSYTKSKQKEIIIDLDSTIDPDVDEFLITDKLKVRQILLNLLSNAIKFTEQGTVKLEVEKKDRFIKFSVSDTGIGIKDEEKEKIFLEFHRVKGFEDIEGTGLGLVISKRLVELLGGMMGFESTYGEGSVFWFELPG